jgi:DNA-binding CsgD family transcriptional regulator
MTSSLSGLGKSDLLFLLETSFASIHLSGRAGVLDLLDTLGAAVPARGVVGTVVAPQVIQARSESAADARRSMVVRNYAAHGFTDEWLAEYARENYFAVDPTKKALLRGSDAFRWADCFVDVASAEERRYVARARDHGVDQGFTVSARPRGGALSFFAFLGEELTTEPRHQAVLSYLGPFLHEALCAADAGGEGEARVKPAPLSSRELEVLRWTMAGKTNWEISMILSLSERTVKFHLGNAMHKLRASSRTHAVAIALRRGLVTP